MEVLGGEMSKIANLVKYKNRKIYDSLSGGYVTYNDILIYLKQGYSVRARMGVTNEDITEQLLKSLLKTEATNYINKLNNNRIEEILIKGIQELR